jgi:PAS domain S-box-containing protein
VPATDTHARRGAAEGARARGRSALSQILAQQAAIAELSQHALGEPDRDALLSAASAMVSRILGTELVSVLELSADGKSLKVVAGVGWRPGVVGHWEVAAATGSQSGFTLASGATVTVADLASERRFAVAPMLIEHGAVAGLAARIGGPDRPFGTISAFTGHRGRFTLDDARFLEAVASVLASALARLAAEKEMRNSRDELAAILASVSEGITVQDSGGRLLYANDAAARLTGLRTAEEMMSLPAAEIVSLFDLIDAEGQPLPPDRLPGRIAMATKRPVSQTVIGWRSKQSGEERWSSVQASPIMGPGGQPSHVVSVFRDITAERLAEQTREAFLGIMSHELRTPITTIYGGSELLAHGLDGDRREDVIRDIRAEAGRLARLVEDLLVFTRVERGGLEIADEPLLLQRLLPAVGESLRPTWPTLNIQLSIASHLPAVRGDATYIEQVVRNLVVNAIRYGDALSAGVELSAEAEGEEVLVVVRDHGPGLAGIEPQKLFELFYRSPSARAVSGGAGIGLFVCRALVDAMGGRIWAGEHDQGGAVFGFALQAIEGD